MARINSNYSKLAAGYLFPEIGRRVAAFCESNPDADVIRLGIGDVTEPLPAAIIEALHNAVDEMASRDTFRGYGPDFGYPFLKQAIAEHDYASRGVTLDSDEIFVSDGSKCDSGNILDIFGPGNVVTVVDPVYPVYVDTNVMAGNTGAADDAGRYDGIVYVPVTEENGFVPKPPEERVDLIYLCYPNNPTGTVATKETLKTWVDYAHEQEAILLFDGAYEAYITDAEIPHSIYEIDGAREVANRIPQLQQERRFHGRSLRLHRRAERPTSVVMRSRARLAGDSSHSGIAGRAPSSTSAGVRRAARGGGRVFARKAAQQVRSLDRLFYLTNAKLLRQEGLEIGRHHGLRRRQRTVRLAEDSRRTATSWDFFDELLSESPPRRYPRQRLRRQWRGLLSLERVQ